MSACIKGSFASVILSEYRCIWIILCWHTLTFRSTSMSLSVSYGNFYSRFRLLKHNIVYRSSDLMQIVKIFEALSLCVLRCMPIIASSVLVSDCCSISSFSGRSAAACVVAVRVSSRLTRDWHARLFASYSVSPIINAAAPARFNLLTSASS